jgi:anti-sigma factor RsiW
VTGPPTEPSHAEIEALLGAYALDATDPQESALVEQHLLTCVRCATEVAQHYEVAGLLANSGGEAPPQVWDGIAAQLEGSEPPSWDRLAARLGDSRPVADGNGDGDDADDGAARIVPIARARSRRLARAGGVVAAAAVALAVVLGVQVDHLHHQLNTPALTRAEQSALAQPSTQRIELRPPSSASSATTVTVVLTRSGTGFVQGRALAALPTGRTYQLWGMVGGQSVSLGLLGRAPHVAPFSAAGHAGLRGFAITDEQAGGAVTPSAAPIVEGLVTA